MGVYFKVGNIDLSGFLTENDYKAEISPVYDEENSFVNIYGKTVHEMIGSRVNLKAKLYEVDNSTAAELSSLMKQQTVEAVYSAPELCEGEFEPKLISLSLDCVENGVKYWTVEIELYADLIAYSSL